MSTRYALYKGTTSIVANKLIRSHQTRQGTTSVVPQTQQKKGWALAPAGRFPPDLLEFASLSAAR